MTSERAGIKSGRLYCVFRITMPRLQEDMSAQLMTRRGTLDQGVSAMISENKKGMGGDRGGGAQ